jgi:hypothetical protein
VKGLAKPQAPVRAWRLGPLFVARLTWQAF